MSENDGQEARTYHVPADGVLEHVESPGENMRLVDAKVGEDGDLWIRTEDSE